ncbi:MAG: nodulation protein NfeD, partial [candidate division NC10 bacterium]
MKRFLISVLPFVLVVLGPEPAWAAEPVALIQIDGVISPVTVRLVSMAIDRAQAEKAQALIIQLDTPGGLERSM